MKPLRTIAEVAGCTVTGGVLIALGWHLFWLGGAVEASQPGGGSGNTGSGVLLLFLGLGTLTFPVTRRVIRFTAQEIRRHKAWLATLSPQERAVVRAAELAAATGAAIAFHEHVKHQRERTRARYDATDAASASWLAQQAQWAQAQHDNQAWVSEQAAQYQPTPIS